MDGDQIVDLLTLAGAMALVAVSILSLALAWLARIAIGKHRDCHEAEAYSDTLKRRLEDVEALRRREAGEALQKTRNALRDAGCRCQRWPTLQANDCPLHGEEGGPCPAVIVGMDRGEDEWLAQVEHKEDGTFTILGLYKADQPGDDLPAYRSTAGRFRVKPDDSVERIAGDLIRTHLGDPPFGTAVEAEIAAIKREEKGS